MRRQALRLVRRRICDQNTSPEFHCNVRPVPTSDYSHTVRWKHGFPNVVQVRSRCGVRF